MFPYRSIKISRAVGCRLCARHASDAALPPRSPFAGRHLCWDVCGCPCPSRQSVERGRFRPGGVDLTPSCPQGAFPARLKKVFIVGAPMWFRVPYSIISLLLKEKLRERVSVVLSPAPALDPRWGGLRLFSLWDRMVEAACAPQLHPLEAAEPKSVGNGGFLSLFCRGQPLSVFSANILNPF